MQFNIISLII